MKARQLAGYSALGLGVGLLAVSLLADVIGIGNDLCFGVKQTTGTIAGILIAFLGLMSIRGKKVGT